MIIYLVIKNQRKTPYKRILLGLSVCDIIASTTYAISPFLLPQATSQRVWARGTDRSCSILGFLTQFAFSAIWYNGMLSFYYLLTVRFGVKTQTFARRFEPIIHIVCVGYNFVTALVGLILGFYSESELAQQCWIGYYPKDCGVTGGCIGTQIGWAYGGGPVLIMFLAIITNNLLIYCFVRRTIQKGKGASMRGSTHQQKRIQAVATQAFLYVGTFFMAYSWAFIIKVLESMGYKKKDEETLFPVLVLFSLLLPIQGVFNLMVYTRPNYLRVQQEFPGEPRWWILKRAWFGTQVQRITSVDASLQSNFFKTKSLNVSNVSEARYRASQQFSRAFTEDPLRKDSMRLDSFRLLTVSEGKEEKPIRSVVLAISEDQSSIQERNDETDSNVDLEHYVEEKIDDRMKEPPIDDILEMEEIGPVEFTGKTDEELSDL